MPPAATSALAEAPAPGAERPAASGILRWVLLGLGLVAGWLSLIGPIGSMIVFHRYLGDYLGVFWEIARDPGQAYRHPGFSYPPPSLLLLRPFGWLPFVPSLVAWDLVGAAALAWAARRMVPPPVIALAFVSFAGIDVLANGQTSLFVAAFAILGVTAADPRARGPWFALAALIKPQSLLAVPVALLARRDGRAIGWALVTATALVLLTMAVFGADIWLRWIECAARFPALLASKGVDRMDVGLYGLARSVGLPGWLYLLGVPLGLGCVVLTFAFPAPMLERYAALAAAAVLLSPYTLGYDLFGLSLVSIALLLDERRSPAWWAAGAMILSTVASAAGIVWLAALLARDGWRRRAERAPG